MQEHEKWLAIAKYDLKVAKVLQSQKFFTASVYHCQQAYEKTLKGYLCFKKNEILKTHDLIKLMKLCAFIDVDFNKHKEAAGFVNPFSTKFRYPTEYDIPDLNDAKLAIKNTSSILRFVTKKIAEPETDQKNIFSK